MGLTNPKGVAALAGVALTTLAASAWAAESAALEEGIKMCVEMREKIFECKEEFADAFVARFNPPEEKRKALRERALKEIIADGSGPLEPRRQACAAMAKDGKAPPQEKINEMKKTLADCGAKTNCKERVACFASLMRPGQGRSVKK